MSINFAILSQTLPIWEIGRARRPHCSYDNYENKKTRAEYHVEKRHVLSNWKAHIASQLFAFDRQVCKRKRRATDYVNGKHHDECTDI